MSAGATRKPRNNFAGYPALGGAALLADPIPLANGGTGATTADGARTALATIGGSWTPTRSAEVNLDSNVTFAGGNYLRIGSYIHFAVQFTADPTLTATTTSFELTPPVASDFAATSDASGVAVCGAIAGMSGSCTAVVANNTLKVSWVASDINSNVWSLVGGMVIL